MKSNTLGIYLLSQVLTTSALLIGFITNDQWIGIPVVITSVCFLWIGERKQWMPINSFVFVIQISIAILGASLKVAPFLMIAGSIGALASWDIRDILENQKNSVDNPFFEKYQINRIRFLGLVIGLGLIITEFGLLIHTSLPFVFVFIITIIVLFCIYKLFSTIKKMKTNA